MFGVRMKCFRNGGHPSDPVDTPFKLTVSRSSFLGQGLWLNNCALGTRAVVCLVRDGPHCLISEWPAYQCLRFIRYGDQKFLAVLGE